jgi:hypothetical protein
MSEIWDAQTYDAERRRRRPSPRMTRLLEQFLTALPAVEGTQADPISGNQYQIAVSNGPRPLPGFEARAAKTRGPNGIRKSRVCP